MKKNKYVGKVAKYQEYGYNSIGVIIGHDEDYTSEDINGRMEDILDHDYLPLIMGVTEGDEGDTIVDFGKNRIYPKGYLYVNPNHIINPD